MDFVADELSDGRRFRARTVLDLYPRQCHKIGLASQRIPERLAPWMAAIRLLMRRLREMLRLKYEAGLPHRAIAQACAVGLGTVSLCLARATAAGVTWPLPDGLDDAALEARLFARPAYVVGRDRALPAWSAIHQELKRPGVTLQLVWSEYRAAHPTGYAYSQFCARYRRWARTLKPSMRQVHRAGEKLFVDFSGTRPSLIDLTGLQASEIKRVIDVLRTVGE